MLTLVFWSAKTIPTCNGCDVEGSQAWPLVCKAVTPPTVVCRKKLGPQHCPVQDADQLLISKCLVLLGLGLGGTVYITVGVPSVPKDDTVAWMGPTVILIPGTKAFITERGDVVVTGTGAVKLTGWGFGAFAMRTLMGSVGELVIPTDPVTGTGLAEVFTTVTGDDDDWASARLR